MCRTLGVYPLAGWLEHCERPLPLKSIQYGWSVHTICVTRANSLPDALYLHSLLNSSQILSCFWFHGQNKKTSPRHILKQACWALLEDSKNHAGWEVGPGPESGLLQLISSYFTSLHLSWRQLLEFNGVIITQRELKLESEATTNKPRERHLDWKTRKASGTGSYHPT